MDRREEREQEAFLDFATGFEVLVKVWARPSNTRAGMTIGKDWVGVLLPLGTINCPRHAEAHRKRRLGAKVRKAKRVSRAIKSQNVTVCNNP